MNTTDIKFLTEIKEMIMKKQYNEEAVNKLSNLIEVSETLAYKEKNPEAARTLTFICIVGKALINELYKLKDKQ